MACECPKDDRIPNLSKEGERIIVMIVKIFVLLFIGVVLHLATILLSREVDKSEGSNATVSYLGSIVILGFNILKVYILFAIILQVMNFFGLLN